VRVVASATVQPSVTSLTNIACGTVLLKLQYSIINLQSVWRLSTCVNSTYAWLMPAMSNSLPSRCVRLHMAVGDRQTERVPVYGETETGRVYVANVADSYSVDNELSH